MLWFSVVSFQRAGQEISLYIYWQSMLQTDTGAHLTLTQVTAASLRFIIYFVHHSNVKRDEGNKDVP